MKQRRLPARKKFDPEDWIALATLVGCMVLIGFKRDGTVASVFLTVTGYMFGRHSRKR